MRKVLKIIAIIAAVVVCALVITCSVAILRPGPTVTQEGIPTSPSEGESQAPTAEPEPEAPPETPPSEIDWSKVEIQHVTESEISDVYYILYGYPLPGHPFFGGSVTIKKSNYTREAIRAAIEQDIPERLAKMQEQERLKKEAEEILEGGGNEQDHQARR